MITLSRLYDDYDTAARAVAQLERAGIPHNDISIVANNSEGWYDRNRPADVNRTDVNRTDVNRTDVNRDPRAEGARTGAEVGGALGGIAGLLAGIGLLAIPGLGPVVAAGWLVSTAAVALAGGAAGGVIGALTEAGVGEHEANAYAEGIRRGGTLVTARVPETERAACEAILNPSAVDVRERVSGWERNGWNRFDPNAAPLTADEIRRERETYRRV